MLAISLSMVYVVFYSKNKTPHNLSIVLVSSLFIRLLFLTYPPGDDYYRYAWEGKIQQQNINPYETAPDHTLLKNSRDELWTKINHPELPAIYPPLSLLMLKNMANYYPSPFILRIAIFMSEIFALILMSLWLKQNKKPYKHLLIYGWNPLPLLYFSGELHLDAFIVPLLAVFILCLNKKKYFLSAVMLTIASGIKILPIMFIPLLVHKKSLYFLPVFLFVPISYFMFTGQLGNFGSFWVFAQNHSFNSFLYPKLNFLLGSYTQLAILLICTPLVFVLWLTEPRVEKLGLYIAASFLIFSPTIHPWYLSLIFPFLVFNPSRPFIFLSLILPLGLLPMNYDFFYSGIWKENHVFNFTIWILFYISCIHSLLVFKRQKQPTNKQTYNSISLVIPTLNEEKNIESILNQAKHSLNGIQHEIIIVDAGSTDNTSALTQQHPCKFINSPRKGRGYQLKTGLEIAQKDICVFLHADCKISDDFFKNILLTSNSNPKALGGWNEMKFDSNRLDKALKRKLNAIQMLNNIRAKYLGIAFGDQGQYILTKKAKELRLLENMPLMEDVNLSYNLKANGDYSICPQSVLVSPRRWKTKKSSSWLVVKMVVIFLFLKRMGWLKPENEYFVKKYYG